MLKTFEVACAPGGFLPLYTLQTSSFGVPEPKQFESQKKAGEYAKTVKQQWPTVECSIREVMV